MKLPAPVTRVAVQLQGLGEPEPWSPFLYWEKSLAMSKAEFALVEKSEWLEDEKVQSTTQL